MTDKHKQLDKPPKDLPPPPKPPAIESFYGPEKETEDLRKEMDDKQKQ